MLEFTSKLLKTDVTCIKCFKNLILTGIGNNLHIFTTKGALLQVYPVFQGQKIHGIIPNSTNKIVVFGGNVLKIIEFDFFQSVISKDLSVQYCKDWIFAVQWLDSDTHIATIFAKNFISLWSTFKTNIKYITSVQCEESCTLYSATLVNTIWSNLFVLSGTIFGQILVWKPADSIPLAPVLYRLEGHDGAIFSIAYSQTLNIITTTSDDRTVRIWSLSNNFFKGENESTDFTLKHTMYGHIARVFRCKITDKFIITTGEDSFVHIWNLDGKLVRKFETHQGGSVWALDYCNEKDLVVTGGGDGGISLYPLNVSTNIDLLPMIENETPRSLKLTSSNNIVAIMDSGWLKYYITNKNSWINVQLLEDLKSYAILEISQNRELIALASIQGVIHIFKEDDSELKKCCSFSENDNSSRIFSLCWLNINEFLTSTVNGVMNIWCLKLENNYEAKKKQKFILPPCKERWATCAIICFENKLVVGDRKGNILLYELNIENPIQFVKKAHCHLGVTSFHFINGHLYSLGRNGILNKYLLNSSNELFQLTNEKLPFSWLAAMREHNNTTLIIGFSGANLILYNLHQRRIILDINCGGGHRSWDLMIKENILNFYFIKEKRLNQFCENLTNIFIQDIISGYHTKEINCIDIVKIKDNQFLFISGGEDTTLRLFQTDLRKKVPKLLTIDTLKSHLSSIRCIILHPIGKNSYLMFSGGGRAQIIMYKLQITSTNDKSEIICQQIESYYKKLDDNEAETRIMDFVIINLSEIIFLIAGSSDGTLICFSINLKDNIKLEFISAILNTLKCITKLSYIKIYDHHVVISMATDGNLTFWDFTKYCEKFEGSLKPFYSLKANQSGINSVCIKNLENETYLFATGGDDNSINLNVIDFAIVGDTINPDLKCTWINSTVHGAQITGIFVNNNHFITTSVDQYICVFKYLFKENSLKCQLLSQYCSTVSDVQGMNCVLAQNEIFICIYGKGTEIIKLNV